MRFEDVSIGDYLVEDGYHEDCGFTHSGLCLAENVMSLESKWNSFDLYLTGMFKAALPDGSLEFILKEELVPSCKVGSLVLFVLDFLWLLVI
jgi:hypothetical protein